MGRKKREEPKMEEETVSELPEVLTPSSEPEASAPSEETFSVGEPPEGVLQDVVIVPEPEPPHAVTACPARPEMVGGLRAAEWELLGLGYCDLCVPGPFVPCPDRPSEALAQIVIRLDAGAPVLGVRRVDGHVRAQIGVADLFQGDRLLLEELIRRVSLVPGACGCASVVAGHHPDCEVRS